MNKLRVLVADDHEQMRWTIVNILDPHFEVVGAVADGRKLVEAAIALQPDVVVSDILMPLLTGPEAMKELQSSPHNVPFVLMSGTPSNVALWIEQGVMSFVDKFDAGHDLVPAVHSAAAGKLYLSRGVRSYFFPEASADRPSTAPSRYPDQSC